MVPEAIAMHMRSGARIVVAGSSVPCNADLGPVVVGCMHVGGGLGRATIDHPAVDTCSSLAAAPASTAPSGPRRSGVPHGGWWPGVASIATPAAAPLAFATPSLLAFPAALASALVPATGTSTAVALGAGWAGGCGTEEDHGGDEVTLATLGATKGPLQRVAKR